MGRSSGSSRCAGAIAPACGRLFARLSPESRLRRFLSPMPALSERDLTFLSDVGRGTHEAMAAVDPDDGSVAGIARYVEHHGRPGVADVAVAVADEMQRCGIGSALMDRLIACAQANGFHLLTATTLWENRPARALLRSMGFHAIGSDGAEIELELKLDVAPPPLPGAPARLLNGRFSLVRRVTMRSISAGDAGRGGAAVARATVLSHS